MMPPYATAKVYRHELKPVMTRGATAMDEIFRQRPSTYGASVALDNWAVTGMATAMAVHGLF
jgi:hypothetical protein